MIVEVVPAWILFLDQIELPLPLPRLDLLLACNREPHILVSFGVDKGMYCVLFREALNQPVLVFENPSGKVVWGYPGSVDRFCLGV